MNDSRVPLFGKIMLFVALGHFVLIAYLAFLALSAAEGLLLSEAQPLGGDFINLISTGQMVLAGLAERIYDPNAFMAFQRSIIDADIFLRLWAYPPHSLLFAWPFGLIPFVPGLVIWGLLGVTVLGLAAKRYGFAWWEIALLVTSPAALQNAMLGQSGSLAAGLMLMALSQRGSRDAMPVLGAALLTIKPQAGFLLPLLWLIRRQWWLILMTGGAVLALCAITLMVFGPTPWIDYLGKTVPLLGELEKYGSGPFMLMIPTVFMSARIFAIEGDLALTLHLVFAAILGVWLIVRLVRTDDRTKQVMLLLFATCLMTPYIHHYDLTLLLIPALLLLRRTDEMPAWKGHTVRALVVFAWALPEAVLFLNSFGLPIAPLAILALFVLA